MLHLKESIFEIHEEAVQRIFDLNGNSPFQDPKAIQARFFALPVQSFVCFSFYNELSELEVATAFERMDNNIWRCFILSDGFIAKHNVNFRVLVNCLQTISDRLGNATLYFPYIDSRSCYFSFFSNLENASSLQRLSSPIINWRQKDQLFIDKIRQSSKKRAQRFWNKFEKKLTLKILTGEEGISALDLIETASWKYKACQSMHFRDNQFAFYSNWLKRKGLTMHVALDEEKPVAYVLSAKIKNTLYSIKYSYDAAYQAYSPGYYLLTKGNYFFWNDKNIEAIDLWGSPDTLKNSIKSAEYTRFDFIWPANQKGKSFLEERKNHDIKLKSALDHNQGLKKIYEKNNS